MASSEIITVPFDRRQNSVDSTLNIVDKIGNLAMKWGMIGVALCDIVTGALFIYFSDIDKSSIGKQIGYGLLAFALSLITSAVNHGLIMLLVAKKNAILNIFGTPLVLIALVVWAVADAFGDSRVGTMMFYSTKEMVKMSFMPPNPSMGWYTVTFIIFLTSLLGDILIYFLVFANRARRPYAPNPSHVGTRPLTADEVERLNLDGVDATQQA